MEQKYLNNLRHVRRANLKAHIKNLNKKKALLQSAKKESKTS